MDELVAYLYNTLDYKKHINHTSFNENNHFEHIELLLGSNIVAPEDGEL